MEVLEIRIHELDGENSQYSDIYEKNLRDRSAASIRSAIKEIKKLRGCVAASRRIMDAFFEKPAPDYIYDYMECYEAFRKIRAVLGEEK